MRIYLSQVLLGVKLYSRSPVDLAWMIAFPIVLLICLGTLFGGSVNAPAKLAWLRGSAVSALDERFEHALVECGFRLEYLNAASAASRGRAGKLAALLEGSDGAYRLRIDPSSGAQAKQVEASVQQAYLTAQASTVGAAESQRIPVELASASGNHDARYVAYLLPGLLGFGVLAMGIFNTGIADVATRAKGGYRRLATTPLPRYVYLAAQLSVRLLVVFASSTLLILVGALIFGVRNQGNYLSLAVLLLLGAACFISLGYLLASFARTTDSYDGVANVVFIPAMMLSGIYFSLDAAPEWLQGAAEYLPLTAWLRAMRAVFNDGAAIAAQQSSIALVGAWTVILFVLAVWRFRWV